MIKKNVCSNYFIKSTKLYIIKLENTIYMSNLFTFSNVNTIKDIDSISNKRNLLIFEKYI